VGTEPATDGKKGRLAAAAAAARQRTRAAEAWGEAKRQQSPWAAWLYDVYERDRECGGGLLAGALAYRFFIWLLPFVLVLVGGLGVVSAAASETPEELAGQSNMSALVTASVQSAAKSNARWYALLIGVPILLYTTRTLLRSLIGVNRLIWTARVRRASPTAAQTLGFLGIMSLFLLVSGIAASARASSTPPGLVVTLAAAVVYGGLWLLVSWWLPHDDAPRRSLLPGSAVFAVGTLGLHVFWGYVIGPLASSRHDTYGSLGIAAALLLGLYFLGRLLVVSGAVNATLWERRQGGAPEAPTEEQAVRRELGSL
jgi:membrane protein